MGKSTRIRSAHVRFGKRTYFFDINQTESKKKYLKITESKFVEEGKPHLYNSFILWPENLGDFQKNLSEMAGDLTKQV